MVRFVVGPEGQIVPDVAEKLPGRGIWVKADRESVTKAAVKGMFARAAKAKVKADAGLADRVSDQLRNRALGSLKLARRAGQAVGGFEKVKGWLKQEHIAVLIHAAEATEDGVQKLDRIAGDAVIKANFFTQDELNEAFAHPNLIHVAVKSGGLGDTLAKECARLAGFVERTPL